MTRRVALRLALILMAAGPAGAGGAEVQAPDISPPDSWQPRRMGTIHVLNKIDATVTTLTLNVGETRDVQSLTISLTGCFVRPPDLPADAAAHLSITDRRTAGQAVDAPGFSGWLLHREPALNMLEHPVYDVQLVGCS